MAAYGTTRTLDGWLAAVEALPLVELSATGIVMAVNQSYCALVGRPASELAGCSIYGYTHPDEVLLSHRNIEMQPGGPDRGRQFEKRYVQPDGTVVWVRVMSSGAATLSGSSAASWTSVPRSAHAADRKP